MDVSTLYAHTVYINIFFRYSALRNPRNDPEDSNTSNRVGAAQRERRGSGYAPGGKCRKRTGIASSEAGKCGATLVAAVANEKSQREQ